MSSHTLRARQFGGLVIAAVVVTVLLPGPSRAAAAPVSSLFDRAVEGWMGVVALVAEPAASEGDAPRDAAAPAGGDAGRAEAAGERRDDDARRNREHRGPGDHTEHGGRAHREHDREQAGPQRRPPRPAGPPAEGRHQPGPHYPSDHHAGPRPPHPPGWGWWSGRPMPRHAQAWPHGPGPIRMGPQPPHATPHGVPQGPPHGDAMHGSPLPAEAMRRLDEIVEHLRHIDARLGGPPRPAAPGHHPEGTPDRPLHRLDIPEDMRRMLEQKLDEGRRRMEQAQDRMEDGRRRFQELEERIRRLEAEVERLRAGR